MSNDITIRTELRSGDLGRIIMLHGEVYDDGGVHFGLPFEAFVARTIADYILDNKAKGQVWLAEHNNTLCGCAAIIDRNSKGQLRWVLVSPALRGTGLGKKLVLNALDYARQQNWSEVYLETTEGLDASMQLYQSLGFYVVSETKEKLWSEAVQKLIVMRNMLE